MPQTSINRWLNKLEELKLKFEPRAAEQLDSVLTKLSGSKISDADNLIRLHEALLFVAAYPQNAQLRRRAQSLLKGFSTRIRYALDQEVDLSSLEHPEMSGIAGMPVVDTFSYFIVRWLAQRYPKQISFYWDWFEDENRLAQTWPRFMPLLGEDAAVEANVPYREWLRAAFGPSPKDVATLIRQFESLPKSDKEKAELYDSQQLYVQWTPPQRASRTQMQLRVRDVFYHRGPLIKRRDVSLPAELEKPSVRLELLSPRDGEAMLDLTREASTTRYRELYGFTHGDPRRVFKTNIGRGVEIAVTGLLPEWRLPLRAYHAAMIFKNGIPVGYFEGLSLFERMESGFNLYYTFRDGETAWLYARVLNIFRHLAGVTAFAIDPYQIGHENEEGIESGAFWFYRKLGFRPTGPLIRKLVSAEEEKLRTKSEYRTSKPKLRKLAAGPMIFELDQNNSGDWDRFQVRNIGLATQRRMASKFAGDARRMRNESLKALNRSLQINSAKWSGMEQAALSDFAVVLEMVPDLQRWTNCEKDELVEIIKAKRGGDEAAYLKLMQKHRRLRTEFIRLGSGIAARASRPH
ncbi:MAG TPA: hypothetical protein VJT50_10275 [Pyrinomonadaceae bacterium]|nr:hypothetical protein [Pyrinomonadaceae bacterium]